MNKNILAIDVGSDKTFSIISTIKENKLRINGYGSVRTQGIRNGIITNIESASKSIKESVENAKRLAGINIKLATVSISSVYTKNITSVGVINIPNNLISINEIDRIMKIALYNASISNEYEVIHVLPFRFKVDDQDYVEDPYGMTGSRLEVDTNIILISKGNLKNFKKSFEDIDISISRIVSNSYSLAISIMQEDEREKGAIIMNLGSGTSSISVCLGNAIQYDYSIKIGSQDVTNDLSSILNTPLNIAEYIKRERGDLTIDYTKETEINQYIEVPIIGDEDNLNNVSLQEIQEIIFCRIQEIVTILIDRCFKDSQSLISKIKPRIILTGGITYIKGVKGIVHSIVSDVPLRIGFANKEFSQISEDFSYKEFTTALGLLYYENEKHTEYELDSNKNLYHSKERYIDEYNFQKHNRDYKPKVSVSEPSFNNSNEDSLNNLDSINYEDPKGFWKFISKIF